MKMNKKRSSTFKISVDSERPESLLKSKRENIQAEKLGRRITVAAILVLIFAGAGIFAAYTDMLRRLNKIEVSGKDSIEKEIGGISKELEEKLADLAKRYEKMDESIGQIGKSVANTVAPVDELLPILEKSVNSMKAEVAKTEQEIKTVNEAVKKLGEALKKIDDSKTDKKELAEAAEKIEKSVESLRQNVGRLDTDIAAVDEKFTQKHSLLSELTELPEIMKTLNQKVEKINKDVATIKSGDIYRRVIDIALKNQEKSFKQELDVIAANLKLKDKAIKKLEARIGTLERAANTTAIKRALPKPNGAPAFPKPGKIIEKDIE